MNVEYSDYVKNVVINDETLLECSGTEKLFMPIYTYSHIANCEMEVTINFEIKVSILNGNYTII